MTIAERFTAELANLLDQYNAEICLSIDGGAHGITGESIGVLFLNTGEDVTLAESRYIDAETLRG